VASKGARGRSRPRARTHALSVVPTAQAAAGRLWLARYAPSGRSLVVGLALLGAAVGAYEVARQTPAFAIREITVAGAPAHVARQARDALATVDGESLLEVDLDRLETRLEAVPTVAAVSFDRGFPHTLTATIVPERPVGVLRRGPESWLVAASGRVIAPLERGARAGLPRIWISRGVDLRLGEPVAGDLRGAVRAIAPLVRHPLPARVTAVRSTETELTLVLRAGFELRLGDDSDRALKLELARRLLPSLLPSGGYLDVSVPERPVAASTLDSQVEVESHVSTTP
jgi:cell division protein FtsQ